MPHHTPPDPTPEPTRPPPNPGDSLQSALPPNRDRELFISALSKLILARACMKSFLRSKNETDLWSWLTAESQNEWIATLSSDRVPVDVGQDEAALVADNAVGLFLEGLGRHGLYISDGYGVLSPLGKEKLQQACHEAINEIVQGLEAS